MINWGKEGSFVSSLSETWRADNNNVLRSGFGLIWLEEALRDEDMLGKHESEYLVTLHMVLMDWAELVWDEGFLLLHLFLIF
jgi:hypothetical protein